MADVSGDPPGCSREGHFGSQMSATSSESEVTALRSLEMHCRTLPLEGQMAECIELLQCPDVALDDLRRSVSLVTDDQTDAASGRDSGCAE